MKIKNKTSKSQNVREGTIMIQTFINVFEFI